MNPGDLFWIDYPTGDGREQAGRRPSLILQDDRFASASPLVFTIPLTSTPVVLRFPAVVPVVAAAANGLTNDSFILVFQARATDRNRLRNRLGTLEPAVLAEVYDALDRLTGRFRPPGTP